MAGTVENHLLQMERLFNGERLPRGPGEVMDLMQRDNFKISMEDAERFKAQWAEEDKDIHLNMRRIYKMKGGLPPCHHCHAKVVSYCYETGIYCTGFNSWTDSGKTHVSRGKKELTPRELRMAS